MALSLALLAAVPVVRYIRAGIPDAPSSFLQSSRAAPATPAADLVLSEANFAGQGTERRIAGSVRNTSGSPYRDVEVTFMVRSAAGAPIGAVKAVLGSLAAGETAGFQTGVVPEQAQTFAFREFSGTPR